MLVKLVSSLTIKYVLTKLNYISIHFVVMCSNFLLPLLKLVTVTLKAPITTAAEGIHKYFFIVFQRK